MMSVAPAHPQKSGDNPFSMFGSSNPINPKLIIATSISPIISSIFAIVNLPFSLESKRYMVL